MPCRGAPRPSRRGWARRVAWCRVSSGTRAAWRRRIGPRRQSHPWRCECTCPRPKPGPGVLDLPEVLVLRGLGVHAVADQDAVVQLGAAVLGRVHATRVQLEGLVVSLDGHGHGLLGDSLHERVLVVGGHVLEAVDGDGAVVAAEESYFSSLATYSQPSRCRCRGC